MYELEHTAEHVFVRALQNLSKNILVRKVEHGDISKVYIESDNLTLDDIYKAECIANEIIDNGLEVKEYIFNSLEEAKESFPDLRAYEERIEGKTRVVEIVGYDHAACIKQHVKNTKLCEFFIVKHVSREKNVYQIQFLAGKMAKMQALEFGMRCIKMVNDLKVSMNTLDATLKNMRKDLEMYKRQIIELSKRIVDDIKPHMIDNIRFYKATFHMLDNKTLLNKVGELIKDDNVVVFICNKIDDKCNVILAASNNLAINCSSLLKMLERYGGKGGGKERFATGFFPSNQDALPALEEELKIQIYKRYHVEH